jgi:signal peptidase II
VSSAPKSSRSGKERDARGKKSGNSGVDFAYESPAAEERASSQLASQLLPPVPRSRYIAFAAIALTGLAADLITKQVLFAWLGLPQQDKYFWIIDGYVGFQTAVNRGALFGMGEGYWWVFSLLSVVAAIGIISWLFVWRAAHDWLLTIALGCVMAGIFGNLYDRIGLWDASGLPPEFEHGVRDWILFRYKQYTWPNFNIADCLLVCGAALLMVHAWRTPREEQPAKSASAAS